MKKNIVAIYNTVDEKTKLKRAAAVEFNCGESTFHRWMLQPETMSDDEKFLKDLHKYIFNWRKLEIEKANKLLLDNA